MFIAARSPAARVGFANVSALLRVPQLWDRQVEIYEAVASSPIFPIMSTLPMKRSRKLPLRWNLRLQQSAPASSQELRRCSPRMAAASGAKAERRELGRALKSVTAGDTLLVTRLDRLARSTRDLLNILDAVVKAGAGFRSLADVWADTTTPHGRLFSATIRQAML